jgi:hypothetical protein
MALQEWWFREGDRISGPVKPSELRKLTQLGRVFPATPVSTDKVRWVAASKLKGLFPVEADRVEPGEGAATVATGPRAGSSPTGVHGVATGLPWPIVRVHRHRFGSRDIIQLRPNGISLTSTRTPLTEEMLARDEGGRPDPSWVHIPAESIREVRIRRAGFITAALWWNRFTVETVRGVRHTFRVPDREVPHVTEALRQIAGDRFKERPSRGLSGGEIAMILVALASITLLALAWFYSLPECTFVGLMVLVFVALAALVLARDKRNSQFQPGGSPRKKPRRRRGTGKQPFRSQILGWSIKAIGLCYIIAMIVCVSRYQLFSEGLKNWQYAWVLYLPGIGALILGSRLCLRTFDPRRHPDPRPPVLFLRAFDDDGKKTFQPTGILAQLHGIFRYAQILKLTFVFIIHPTKLMKLFLNADTYSTEELLAKVFRPCGPLVAIGRPGEILATSGAERMYVPDEKWQQVVLDYLGKSQAVILQPAQTEGVRWEIEKVFSLVPRHKILLSMLNFKDRPNLYEEFRSWMKQEHKVALPLALPFQDTPACIYFEADGTVRAQPICYRSPLLWSFIGNAVHVRKTFDPFIRGLHGGRRELPEHPRKSPLQAAFSIPLAVGTVFGFGALLGLIQVIVLPHARIATDIAGDRFREVMPAVALKSAELTAYRGRAIPYEFRLDSEWKLAPIPTDAKDTEYLFDYRGGLGKLEVISIKDVRFNDLYSDSFPMGNRRALETRVRQQVPGATVELTGSHWVEINGRQWRKLSFVQRYSGVLSETRHSLYSSGPSGSLLVQIIMPNHEHYDAVREGVFATLKPPESDIDRLLHSSSGGKPTEYRGKKATFALMLNPAWGAFDLEKGLAEIGKLGQRLKEVSGDVTDSVFRLGDSPNFATLEVTADTGDLDVSGVGKADCAEFLRARQVALESALLGFRAQIDLVDFKKLTIAGKDWIEIRARQTVSKKDRSDETLLIIHITAQKGRILGITAEISRDHPAVRRLVTEALDSIRLEN